HDETAQSLIVVSRHLDDLVAGNSRITAQDIRDEVRKILTEVRHFSQELRPSVLDDIGLIPAVQWLASDLTKNYGIDVPFEITGDQRQLAPESELMLFRIIQEALTNVRKHSQATRAFVKMFFSEDSLRVYIEDNGRGLGSFPGISNLTRVGKLGLTGINERVQLLGGTLKIESRPGEGTSLIVEVPL
ncbi:sensor histidine kinase, partial [Chloroflexota bacterium]